MQRQPQTTAGAYCLAAAAAAAAGGRRRPEPITNSLETLLQEVACRIDRRVSCRHLGDTQPNGFVYASGERETAYTLYTPQVLEAFTYQGPFSPVP